MSVRTVLCAMSLRAGVRAIAPVSFRFAPHVSIAAGPVRASRPFVTTPLMREQDKSWAKKGDTTYAELKPYTEHPSGEITIIDVREQKECEQGMIPSAVNVPLSVFSTAFDPNSSQLPSTDFERIFSFPRPSYDDKIVFYCRSGRRSAQAQEIALQCGWWKYVS